MKIHIENKYKDADEFIKACKRDPCFNLINRLIQLGEIPVISETTLEHHGIYPDSRTGYYYKNQIFELASGMSKEVQRKYGSLPLLELYEEKSYKNFPLILTFNATENKEIKKFLLLTLSERFNKDVKKIRKKYNIPINGFKNRKEHREWHKKTSSELYKKLEHDCFILLCRYRLQLKDINFLFYIFRGIHTKELIETLKYEDKPNIFFTSGQLVYDESYYSPAQFTIAIRRPATKRELKDFIDKNWEKIKKEFEQIDKVATTENLYRDWLIFYFYKKKKTTKGILRILKFKYGIKNSSEAQIKKIISRLKRRIEELEI